VATTRTDELWHLALSKWAEIAVNFPDLEPALAVQQAMLRLLIDAREQLEDSRAPLPETTPGRILEKWGRGVPALRNETIPIPESLKAILPALCGALANGGAGESAAHIQDALANSEIDGGSLLRVSLARNREAIRTSSLHHGFSPDLVWLIGELGSAPLAHYCQTRILDMWELKAAIGHWDRGYCPCCGSWPAFIETVDVEQGPGRRTTTREGGGTRLLRCSYCAAAWELTSSRCVYCGNSDHRFVAAAPDIARPGRRLELCGACGNYTKVIEVASPSPFPLIAIEDLATMDLDQGAMGREYRRPDLIDLDSIDPPSTPNCG
jgi:formate dehydrogenase maturation protein FdhE